MLEHEHAFETLVKAKVAEIKSALREMESVSHFTFEITAAGRVDGQVELTFSLGEYYSDAVKGRDVDGVLEEFTRRHGWNQRNAPLCLPNVEEVHDE